MRTRKAQINIDKLRLSFKQPQNLWNEIRQHHTNDYVKFDGFQLHITDDGRGKKKDEKEEKKEPTKIVADLLIDTIKTDVASEVSQYLRHKCKLGTFTFNNSLKYEGLCFFTFECKSLYSADLFIGNQKHNKMLYIQPIADALGLRINSITEIELARDINFNPTPAIRRMITDYEQYDMIVNRKKVEDENRKIEDYGEWFGRSRRRLNKHPTIYIKQAKEDGQKLKIYNKSQEIKDENHKDYVTKWNSFGNTTDIHRVEVTVKWESFKRWLEHLQTADILTEWKRYRDESTTEYIERTLGLLALQDYCTAMWRYCTDKMLYFRHIDSNRLISLSDIAMPTPRKKKLKKRTKPFSLADFKQKFFRRCITNTPTNPPRDLFST